MNTSRIYRIDNLNRSKSSPKFIERLSSQTNLSNNLIDNIRQLVDQVTQIYMIKLEPN